MSTKEQLYKFLKSAKQSSCKDRAVCGSISTMSKSDMMSLATKLGYSPSNNRIVYNPANDRTSTSPAETPPAPSSNKKKKKKKDTPQEEKKEEVKEETWQDLLKEGNKLKAINDKKLEKLMKDAERNPGRDFSKSKEFKKIQEEKKKFIDIIVRGNRLKKAEKNKKK